MFNKVIQHITAHKSLVTWLILSLIYVYVANSNFLYRKKHEPQWTNLIHDSGIYHAYLPATFIKKDPLWNFLNTENANDPERGIQYWAFRTEQGGWVPKMSMGKAMMDLPFFLIADAYTGMTQKHERTGFSFPYQYAQLWSTIIYALLGLFLIRLVLQRYFKDVWVAWTLFVLALATNLYHYSTHESGMTHPHNFFLLSAALYLVHDWNMERKIGKALAFGLVCGLIVLVRPINLVLLLPLPFFIQLFNQSTFNRELLLQGMKAFFLRKKFILAVAVAFLVVLPQLLFWKHQSGSWLHYSYNDEGFFLSNPSVWKGLFSFRKGWLIYTPVMIFALIGFVLLFRKNRIQASVVSFAFLLFIYLTFSWWCWWYGGGFGARTLIDFYPFLAFGLAAFFTWIAQRKILKYGFFLLVLLLARLNLFQTFQYKLSLIHWDSMTYSTYKAIFLKKQFPENYADLIQEPDYQKQKETGEE